MPWIAQNSRTSQPNESVYFETVYGYVPWKPATPPGQVNESLCTQASPLSGWGVCSVRWGATDDGIPGLVSIGSPFAVWPARLSEPIQDVSRPVAIPMLL